MTKTGADSSRPVAPLVASCCQLRGKSRRVKITSMKAWDDEPRRRGAAGKRCGTLIWLAAACAARRASPAEEIPDALGRSNLSVRLEVPWGGWFRRGRTMSLGVIVEPPPGMEFRGEVGYVEGARMRGGFWRQEVHFAGAQRYRLLVAPGSDFPRTLLVRQKAGNSEAEELFHGEISEYLKPLAADERLVVVITSEEHPPNLPGAVPAATGGTDLKIIRHLVRPEEAPRYWYAYDSVDLVVLADVGLSDVPPPPGIEASHSRLAPPQAEALRQWVRAGGKVVMATRGAVLGALPAFLTLPHHLPEWHWPTLQHLKDQFELPERSFYRREGQVRIVCFRSGLGRAALFDWERKRPLDDPRWQKPARRLFSELLAETGGSGLDPRLPGEMFFRGFDYEHTPAQLSRTALNLCLYVLVGLIAWMAVFAVFFDYRYALRLPRRGGKLPFFPLVVLPAGGLLSWALVSRALPAADLSATVQQLVVAAADGTAVRMEEAALLRAPRGAKGLAVGSKERDDAPPILLAGDQKELLRQTCLTVLFPGNVVLENVEVPPNLPQVVAARRCWGYQRRARKWALFGGQPVGGVVYRAVVGAGDNPAGVEFPEQEAAERDFVRRALQETEAVLLFPEGDQPPVVVRGDLVSGPVEILGPKGEAALFSARQARSPYARQGADFFRFQGVYLLNALLSARRRLARECSRPWMLFWTPGRPGRLAVLNRERPIPTSPGITIFAVELEAAGRDRPPPEEEP